MCAKALMKSDTKRVTKKPAWIEDSSEEEASGTVKKLYCNLQKATNNRSNEDINK